MQNLTPSLYGWMMEVLVQWVNLNAYWALVDLFVLVFPPVAEDNPFFAPPSPPSAGILLPYPPVFPPAAEYVLLVSCS